MKHSVKSVLAGFGAGLAVSAAGNYALFGAELPMYWSRTQHLGSAAVSALAGAVTAGLAVRLSRSRSLAFAAPGLLWPAARVWDELEVHEGASFVAAVAAAGLLAVLAGTVLARGRRSNPPAPPVAA